MRQITIRNFKCLQQIIKCRKDAEKLQIKIKPCKGKQYNIRRRNFMRPEKTYLEC